MRLCRFVLVNYYYSRDYRSRTRISRKKSFYKPANIDIDGSGMIQRETYNESTLGGLGHSYIIYTGKCWEVTNLYLCEINVLRPLTRTSFGGCRCHMCGHGQLIRRRLRFLHDVCEVAMIRLLIRIRERGSKG
jgi:hypothetical protein